MAHRLTFLALVPWGLALISGCSFLSDPCGAVMPAVVASQSRLADVERALSEVETVRGKLPPEATQALDRAWSAYRVAVQSLALASTSCAKPSIATLLTEIVAAWDLLRPFLSVVGGVGTPHAVVTDPLIWQEAHLRGSSD